jgi:hypothetical protein
MVDARDRLLSDPFSYRIQKNGQVSISRGGVPVVIVSGAAAAKLIAALERSDEAEQQLVLAKVTGNYKRGNERR